MNITFLKLYITNEINSSFYNSQEIGLAKAVTTVYPEHRVNIVLLTRGESKTQQITDRVTLYVVKAKGLGHHGRIDLSLLKELKTDLVHLLADNMLYAPNVIRYCRKNGIKYHLYIGTLFTDSNKWYRKTLDRLMMARNIAEYKKSVVYVKTPAVQKQCQELGIEAKLAPVGLSREDVELSDRPVDEIRAQYGIPADKRILLFVGRLEEYKHPLDAVDVMRGLDDHLVIVGQGSLEGELKKRIAEYGFEDCVTIIPRVPNSEMKHLYKACDYFVNFNPDEIYGMSILEAMVHRCLVFAIHAPGPDYLIDDGVTGFLCDSVEEMTMQICKCEAAEDSAARIAERMHTDTGTIETGAMKETGNRGAILDEARKNVLENLTWDRLVARFEDFRF
ncbi:MAG: glycosyltransferase family 4 protein [Butyrivibrio sp.]|nr:glycosyltransferase family 4 protein [Butyrivibrio sp.]